MATLDDAEPFADDDAQRGAADDVEGEVGAGVDAGEGDEGGEAEGTSTPLGTQVGGGDRVHGEGHGAVAGGVAETDAVVPDGDVEPGAGGPLALDQELASSFANRVTPAKVGGLAVNVRWMVKEGVESPVAAAGVSVNALAGFVIHVLGTVFVLLWAGQSGLGDVNPPSGRTIVVAVALVVGVMVLTVSYIGALYACLVAVDATVPVATVALVYLAGSAIASAAPTPGGLGATEATFAAALTAVGVGDADAVPACCSTAWSPSGSRSCPAISRTRTCGASTGSDASCGPWDRARIAAGSAQHRRRPAVGVATSQAVRLLQMVQGFDGSGVCLASGKP